MRFLFLHEALRLAAEDPMLCLGDTIEVRSIHDHRAALTAEEAHP
jgi:hypothetical protein